MKEPAKREIEVLLERYPELRPMEGCLSHAAELLAETFSAGGKLLVCGNGGSAADSLHITGELMKNFAVERRLSPRQQERLRKSCGEDAAYYIEHLQGALPVLSLVGETALITAYGNDSEPALVFAQQVIGYGREGDALLAVSTSGSSANVVHAAKVARAMGLKVVALTGRSGGILAQTADVLLAVPADVTYQIQEYHLPVYHALCLALEKELFC